MSSATTEPARVRRPHPSGKLVGRLLFGVLVLLAALAGTFAGLLVVSLLALGLATCGY